MKISGLKWWNQAVRGDHSKVVIKECMRVPVGKPKRKFLKVEKYCSVYVSRKICKINNVTGTGVFYRHFMLLGDQHKFVSLSR